MLYIYIKEYITTKKNEEFISSVDFLWKDLEIEENGKKNRFFFLLFFRSLYIGIAMVSTD